MRSSVRHRRFGADSTALVPRRTPETAGKGSVHAYRLILGGVMCEHHNAHEDEECEHRGRVERSGGPTTSFQPFLGEERRISIAPVTCCRAWLLVAAHPRQLGESVRSAGGRAQCWEQRGKQRNSDVSEFTCSLKSREAQSRREPGRSAASAGCPRGGGRLRHAFSARRARAGARTPRTAG